MSFRSASLRSARLAPNEECCRALIRSLAFGYRPIDSTISQFFMKPTLTLFCRVFAAGNSIASALNRAASFLPMSWRRASLTLLLMALAAAPLRADVLSLDGNGDYVTFPSTGIPSGSASFTIEAWVNPTTIPTGGENGGTMTFWGTESANQANGFRLRGASGVVCRQFQPCTRRASFHRSKDKVGGEPDRRSRAKVQEFSV